MKFISILLIIFAATNLSAQNTNPVFAEEMPQFPGGDSAFGRYLDSAIVYPDTAKMLGKQGTVYVYFEVDKYGVCGNFKLVRGVPGAPELDAKALRVLQAMPRWSPAMMNGRAVKVGMTIPVKFYLA